MPFPCRDGNPKTAVGGFETEVGRRPTEIRWARIAPSVGLALLVLLLLALPAFAAERSVSDVVLVESGAVISDDLYAAGNRVVIEGRVEGDLIVAAYEDVTITGTVSGDVTGLAGSVVVTGTVGESVRVLSPRIDITGQVGGDVIVVGGNTTLDAEVTGQAVIWGWAAEVAGVIGRDLEGQTRHLRLGGSVEGDVDVTVNRLTVLPGAEVGRDLGYRSSRAAEGVGEAEVAGSVIHRLPLAANIRVRALVVLAKIVLGLLAAVTGLLVMWAVPGASERAADSLRASWWKSWLRGLAVAVSPLVVLGLSGLLVGVAPTEAALPLVGVFLPLFLAVVGLVMALAFTAPAAVYPWLGRAGNHQRGSVRAFLFAAAAVMVASLIPWLSWVVALVVIPVGIGAWVAPAAPPPA